MSAQTLEQFLASVERKAYHLAYMALRNSDDALDVVQDTMLKLVQKYADRPSEEWKPLFYRILESCLCDHHRRQNLRNRVFPWFGFNAHTNDDDLESTEIENSVAFADTELASPENKLCSQRAIAKLESIVQTLPLRQQQAFLLRNWEGFNIEETALAMNCGEGSVKTHYSRAMTTLRTQLGDDWP